MSHVAGQSRRLVNKARRSLYSRMEDASPSRTALRVARLRALHQFSPQAALFRDPYASAILGDAAPGAQELQQEDEHDRRMRLFVASRARLAEDWLAAAVRSGIRQVVVLGAGLDTFSLRNPYPDIAVFEVDHPATQAWKRQRIAEAGLAEPAGVTFVPVNFERQSLAGELAAAGLKPTEPGFFIWLGVVPYLTRDAIFATLAYIARMPGSEVVFDYSEPAENRDEAAWATRAFYAARVAAIGEPWISFFDPVELAKSLTELGFDEIEDLESGEIAARFARSPATARSNSGGHILRARRSA
ncbi:SAM-dependent methyltransferase [Mesorhizobium humile]|uniref:S-adenosyl-L-methionine-dependent methyltransferase n=1 Tax=Mesorhizobium humile TaxID=3072313 RepID=A0ABU4YQP4_9HYPH|nr:SAM-dependent methyltransferase [Mesorhizobium sp. VK2B]MDX8488991.1 SAM-dependent methyltransferase [Mesorhizobium sp. VK2B]